jgi:hypothetical protein
MKGYIYKLYTGADPAKGWVFNDPIFGPPPTLGACVPNIRRVVERGDWVYAVSGSIKGYQPYVVGGFRVEDKISALAAYRRLPENRLQLNDEGQVVGNIIVDSKGNQNALDNHRGFENRLENYLVGDEMLHVSEPASVARAREQTLPKLSEIFGQPANRTSDIVTRWRRLDEEQIQKLNDWLKTLT